MTIQHPAHPRPFASLYNRRTAYEVAIYDGSTTLGVVCYTERRTRDVLLRLAHKHRESILPMMTAADMEKEYRYDSRIGRLYFGDRASIGFTGATEYQRASEVAAA